MIYKFYDTCSLLEKVNTLFDDDENIVISSITLNELENIKTSAYKDIEIKSAARKLLSLLANHEYTIHVYTEKMLKPFQKKGFKITPDIEILATALDFYKKHNNMIFYTNDLALFNIAKSFFNINQIDSVRVQENETPGYKEKMLTDEEISYFYSNLDKNQFGLTVNEYIILRHTNGEYFDAFCWTGETHRRIVYKNLKSHALGNIKPYKGDVYQSLFVDSLTHNKITLVKGSAGTGKTFLSLAYLMHEMEQGNIDKIIVFCNTVATKNSAKLGFYPGSRDEKLHDSQIGNLLGSKLGGKLAVEQMIQEERLMLLPMSDIRGFDTTGMRAGVYISEAQNLDITLMKLALQRIGEDSVCIIDGDCKTQVDDASFAGANNGMMRLSKVFRGEDIFGQVELKTIHRSKIANIAERM